MTIFIGAIIVGLILGLLGSGGSAIMVPILVYLVGRDAKISIAESMAIVGAISASGAVPFARSKQVDWQSVVLFGLPAMLGSLAGWAVGVSALKASGSWQSTVVEFAKMPVESGILANSTTRLVNSHLPASPQA